jgi:hypothetical protein
MQPFYWWFEVLNLPPLVCYIKPQNKKTVIPHVS